TNHITELNHGQIKTYTLTASSLDVKPASLKDLQGGTVADNVAIAKEILDGQPGPKRDVVLLNAAAVLYVAGKAPDLASGLPIAAQAIDSGQAKSKLEQLVRFSQSL
ncbi:MAG: anthranilate phosphoribosyltransferase, partial [Chloroflexota bacterium]